jgi:ubiquinone/menaquinone biosynthesis C-methylase UbiE
MGGIKMSEHTHIGSAETDEVELVRLRLMEDIFDPITTRHLEMLGIAKGWKCLEVGARAGSVAQWLTTRVGRIGKVVATDIETRFLEQFRVPNIEIRQHDIVTDNLEAGEYDLVHCRTLLMQLTEPEKALKQMADAMRPGGWLIIEETDHGSILSSDYTDPSAAPLTAIWRAVNGFLYKKKIVNPYFGRQVRDLVEQLKLIDVTQEGWTCVCRGGEPMAMFDAATLQMAAKPVIGAGLLTKEQLDDALCLLQDPTFMYPALTLFSTCGKKPAQA